MKRAIWATYYHQSSTDEAPQHHYGPYGQDTWCKCKKDASSYRHHAAIPTPIAELIKPAYIELTNDELLSKCLHGGTTNANEYGVLWRIAPKSDFCGLTAFELSSYLAVLRFNDGEGALLRVLGREAGRDREACHVDR